MPASDAISLERPAGGLHAQVEARARGWPWAAGACAVALASCLLWVAHLDLPLHDDEAGYAIAAYWWARGEPLYDMPTITRPQGIFVVFRAIQALGLGSVRGIHFFAAVYAGLCALLVYAIAARVWSRPVGLVAAALFGFAMATPYLEGYNSANAELFMLLPLLGSLALLLRADQLPLGSPTGLGWLAASGLVGALALLIKPAGFVALPVAGLWLLRRRFVEGAPWRAWLRAELALGAGALLGLVPAVVHGLVTAPDAYLDAVLLYRLTKDSALVNPLGDQVLRFSLTALYIALHLPVLLFALPGFRAAHRATARRGRDLLWLWLAGSLAGGMLGGGWYPHYFQQFLPPVAVAAGIGLVAVARRPARPVTLGLQALAVASLAALALALAPALRPDAAPQELIRNYPPSLAAGEAIAAYLRERTEPGERIYVAYQQPNLYYLAERRPAARWLYFRELKWTPGAFAEQVALLADPGTAPRYVVGAQAFDAFGLDPDGALRAVVARDYTLETTIAGVPLFRHKG